MDPATAKEKVLNHFPTVKERVAKIHAFLQKTLPNFDNNILCEF